MSRIGVCLVVIGLAAPAGAQEKSGVGTKPTGVAETEPDRIRTERASTKEPIRITTKLHYQTLIVLPDDDPIVQVGSGDGNAEDGGAGNWVISTIPPATVLIKPTVAGFETNVNAFTKSGAIYSFLVREGRPGGKPLALPDLRVTITSGAPTGVTPIAKYYTAAEYEAIQAARTALQAQLETERMVAQERLAEAKQRAPAAFHFAYRGTDGKPLADVKPFHVKAVFHDDRFTYLRLDTKEKPVLFETKDGKPATLDYQLHGDTFVVPKVLDRAYLALGVARLEFVRTDDAKGN